MDSMKQGLQLLLHKVFHLINVSKSRIFFENFPIRHIFLKFCFFKKI